MAISQADHTFSSLFLWKVASGFLDSTNKAATSTSAVSLRRSSRSSSLASAEMMWAAVVPANAKLPARLDRPREHQKSPHNVKRPGRSCDRVVKARPSRYAVRFLASTLNCVPFAACQLNWRGAGYASSQRVSSHDAECVTSADGVPRYCRPVTPPSRSAHPFAEALANTQIAPILAAPDPHSLRPG